MNAILPSLVGDHQMSLPLGDPLTMLLATRESVLTSEG